MLGGRMLDMRPGDFGTHAVEAAEQVLAVEGMIGGNEQHADLALAALRRQATAQAGGVDRATLAAARGLRARGAEGRNGGGGNRRGAEHGAA